MKPVWKTRLPRRYSKNVNGRLVMVDREEDEDFDVDGWWEHVKDAREGR